MKSSIVTGQYELVESSIIYVDPSETEIIIKPVIDGVPLSALHILLEEDEEQKESRLTSTMRNGELFFHCINFSNSLGTGTAKRLPIGFVNNKKLYLHLWVYSVGTVGTKRIDINIYREKD